MATRKKTESTPPGPDSEFESVAGLFTAVDAASLASPVGDASEVGPGPLEPDWPDWVQSHFAADEVDSEGHPYVKGLRRVGQMLLGRILESESTVLFPPSAVSPAVARHTLVLHGPEGVVRYSDCADADDGNTGDFVRPYLSAYACTRAEGRCWRKALNLKLCAEEKGAPPVEQRGPEGIQPSQVSFLGRSCRSLGIDAWKFINSGRDKYANFRDVTYETALKMLAKLSEWENDPSKVPEALRGSGYKEEWSK